MKSRDNDGLDPATLEIAAKRLALIAPGDDPEALLRALEPCMRVAAGLLMVVKPGETTSVTHHALRIPMPVLEGWMHTQPDYLAKSLFPAVHSNPGDFWSQSDGLSDQLRRGMEVLHVLDQFGLGEGAGLKLLRQPIPGGGEEHILMAVLTHRGERFSRQTSDICRALTQPLQEAMVRLSLPFTVEHSIHARVHEVDAVGFVCLGADGAIIELNQRAYELAAKYREVARVSPGRLFLEAFVKQALRKTNGGQVWQLMHPTRTAMMQIRMYVMPKEKFALSRDLPMLKMEEWSLPSAPEPDVSELPPAFRSLTAKQREIAMLLVNSGLAPQEIAYQTGREAATVRKHIENIHKKLNVHSLGELIALVRKSRN
jgi:DNA-binding CsgD family transcriptional regulator